MSFDFTPEEEDQMYREFAEADQRALRFRATASPQLASTVGQLYANNRDANPGVLLPAAQAVSSGRMTPEQAEKLLADTQRRELDAAKQEKKKKSWWERNVASKVRTASRWTMATLNFVPQTVTGAAAQVFKGDDDVDGWFISTDLGTLIANDEVAGDGFFLGGKAAQLQAERARRYRGEIDGKAWTIGRGFASVISQPGSREYNILSGLVDAVSAVAIPAVPGFQAAKAGAAAAGARAGEVAGVGLFTRSAAGLLDAERAAIDPKKVRAWIDSRGGMQAVEKVADVKTIDEAMQMFPKVQDAKFWLDVIDADDPGKARTLLLDNLGYGVDEFDLGDRNFVARIAGKSSRVAKLMASVPGEHVVLQGGNARDVAQSIKNVDNYLRLFNKGVDGQGITDEIRQGVVTRFARALTSNNGDVYSTMEEIDTITKLILKTQGVPDEAITNLMARTKEYRQLSVYGSLDEFGQPTSFGAKVVLPDGRVMFAPTSTAGTQSEMLNQITAVLPDPRRVRRMVGDLGWVMGKGKKLSNPENYRELRMPASALEFYQNELWRPLTLMTPGYVLRNMTDSAFRLSFTPGLKGGVYHPIQWIMMAQHKRFRGTLTGEMFDDAESIARGGMQEYSLATNQTMREAMDSINLEYRGVKDRVWAAVTRADSSRYRKGLQDEISLLHDDPVMQMIARGDMTSEEIVRVLKTEAWGKEYVEKLQNRWRNKEMVDTTTGQRDVVTADMTNDTNLLSYVNDYATARVHHVARGNEVLRRAIADGKVFLDDGTEVSIFKTTPKGARYDYSDEWTRATERVIADPNVELSPWFKVGIETTPGDLTPSGRQRNKVFKGWDKVVDSFFGSQYPKRSAYLMQSPVFRQYYYQKVSNLVDELNPQAVRQLEDTLRLTRINEARKAKGLPRVQRLENQKLGFVRTDQTGKKVVVELTDSEVAELPKVTNSWLAKYVGDSKLAKRIQDKLINPDTARGELELSELDAYAKGFALDSTKELFYNAAEKSNFADILRVVVPFGSAWAEVISSWTKIAASNPETLKRLGVSVEGLRDADPDNDGRGFFWKDPQTGEYVFNYPFNKQLGPLTSYFGGIGALGGAAVFGARGALAGGAAGLAAGGITQSMFGVPGAELQAPARTLNMGLNLVPGLGPMAQIAASRILGKLPAADDVRRFLTPYGEPELTVLPSWMQKVQDAVQSPESNRMLGDMKIETMRVLAMTGEYDLSNEADKERLENDADSRARTLLMLRALGQFVGPTRPSVEFKVETYAGDVYGSELSKAFRDFQSANYDTAVETFMQVFGDDAFLYMAGKTRSAVGGLDASKEFGNFERDNRSLFARYKDVAGYFAPTGSNFDYQVYLRQLATGQREKLKPSELVAEAQALVGRSIYRNVVRMAGPYPSTEQRDYLRMVRQDLQQRFPGYAYQPMVFNRLESQITQILAAVGDDILDGNPVAEATRIYMDARDQALQEAVNRGFTSLGGKNVADLRAWLRNVADGIIVSYPQFERIYDRVLFNEIDLDAGE
jgi:hypothetical protein